MKRSLRLLVSTLIPAIIRPLRKASTNVKLNLELLEDRSLPSSGSFLQGTAFVDVNHNGVLDGNPYLPGANISLYQGTSAVGTPLATTVTDGNGAYLFNNVNVSMSYGNAGLNPGTYTLVETPPTGYANDATQVLSQIYPATPVNISTIQVTLLDPSAMQISFDSTAFFDRNKWEYYGHDLYGQHDFGTVGQFPVSIQSGGNPQSQFLSFCSDLFNSLGDGTNVYNVVPSLSPNSNNGQATFTSQALGRIGYLYNHYAYNVLAGSAYTPNDMSETDAAGLQFAIWQLLYGNNFTNIQNVDPYTTAQQQTDAVARENFYLSDSLGKSEGVTFLNLNVPPTPIVGAQGMIAAESMNFGNTVAHLIKQTPLIVTSPNPTSVTLGNSPTTLTDAVSISGGNHPTGTVTFTLFAPGNPVAVDTEIVPVTDDGTYATPNGYLLPAVGAVVGTYQWDAVYSGDDNNNLVRENNNVGEQVVVNKAQPKLVTVASFSAGNVVGSAIPQDQAMLSGGYNISGGSITFKLHAPDTSIVDMETVTVTASGTYNTANTVIASQVGTYTWTASYTGDGLNVGASDQADIQEQVTTVKATPTLVTVASFSAGNVVGMRDSARSGEVVGRLQYQRWFDHVQAACARHVDRGYGDRACNRERHLQYAQHGYREPGRDLHLDSKLHR